MDSLAMRTQNLWQGRNHELQLPATCFNETCAPAFGAHAVVPIFCFCFFFLKFFFGANEVNSLQEQRCRFVNVGPYLRLLPSIFLYRHGHACIFLPYLSFFVATPMCERRFLCRARTLRQERLVGNAHIAKGNAYLSCLGVSTLMVLWPNQSSSKALVRF